MEESIGITESSFEDDEGNVPIGSRFLPYNLRQTYSLSSDIAVNEEDYNEDME